MDRRLRRPGFWENAQPPKHLLRALERQGLASSGKKNVLPP